MNKKNVFLLLSIGILSSVPTTVFGMFGKSCCKKAKADSCNVTQYTEFDPVEETPSQSVSQIKAQSTFNTWNQHLNLFLDNKDPYDTPIEELKEPLSNVLEEMQKCYNTLDQFNYAYRDEILEKMDNIKNDITHLCCERLKQIKTLINQCFRNVMTGSPIEDIHQAIDKFNLSFKLLQECKEITSIESREFNQALHDAKSTYDGIKYFLENYTTKK